MTSIVNVVAPEFEPNAAQSSQAHSPSVGLGLAEVLLAASLIFVLSGALAFAMGRDLNWDYFNYHAYAAFDVFGSRLGQDYFPAGIQGYMSRLPYLPFALMQQAGWHSLAIGIGLATLQSLNVLFLYLVARELTTDAARPHVLAATITALGAATNVFALQLGSTFVDPVTTVPVMAAIWLVLRSDDARSAVLVGILGGVAVALKLTNAPFAIGLMAAVIALSKSRWRAAGLCMAGHLAGFLALYGWWGWRLYQVSGSPFFPFFNQVFKAPDFAPLSVSYQRFVPQSLDQLLALPFAMAEHRSWVYVEGVSPDVRPAMLVVLTLLAIAFGVVRRWVGQAGQPRRDGLAVRSLGVFFVVSLLGWLATSGNGRYATPLLLLLGPLLFLAARSSMGERRAAMLCLVVLAIQILRLVDAGNPRWAPNDWSAQWLPGSAPADLQAEPFLYVATSTSSESYLAAHVHPASVFVNPIGLIPVPTDGPGWSRFVALRDRFAGRTKVMFGVPLIADDTLVARRIGTMNDAIDRLGLGIDKASCRSIFFNADTQAIAYPWGRAARADDNQQRRLVVCSAVSLPAPSARLSALRARAAEIVDAFEHKCPSLFSPNGIQIEGANQLWSRLYGKFDLFVTVDFNGDEISYRMQRQATDVILGRVSTWQKDVERFRCRLPHDGARDISTLNADERR